MDVAASRSQPTPKPVRWVMKPGDNGLSIYIVQSALTDLQENYTLVNITSERNNRLDGTILSYISEDARQQLEVEYANHAPDMTCGDIIVTRGVGPTCLAIFHACCISWSNMFARPTSFKTTYNLFFELLKLADRWMAKKIVFPLAFDGVLFDYPIPLVLECFLLAARQLLENPRMSLVEISILVQPDTGALEELTQGILSLVVPRVPEVLLYPPRQSSDPFYYNPKLQAVVEYANIQTIQPDVLVVFSPVRNSVQLPRGTGPLERVYDAVTEAGDLLAALQHGRVLLTRNNNSERHPDLIIHLGFSFSCSAEEYLDKLQHLEEMVLDSMRLADTNGCESIAFPAYPECLLGFPLRAIIKVLINAGERVSSNATTLGLLRFIVPSDKASRQLFEAAADVLEEEAQSRLWQVDSQDVTTLRKLAPDDPDYIRVAEAFRRERAPTEIVEIQISKNDNPRLFARFEQKRLQMQALLNQPDTDVWKWLWHGTRVENVQRICVHNFDPGFFATATAAIYGAGTYFAVSASLSHKYTTPGADGYRYMIHTRVCTGRTTQGAVNQSQPAGFHSTVDQLQNPNQYCIYNKDCIFPEYVVAYK